MKKKVMNIRSQEFTDGGERSVRYKGSDGKMHAMLPQNAAVPVAERTVIEAGTEITLAQAHEIEDFDFNNCASLRFNEGFSPYASFLVNLESSDNADSARFLEYSYPGNARVRFYKDGNYYPFQTSSEVPAIHDFPNDHQGAKEMLEQVLLEIAQQTGKLELYNLQGPSGEQFLVPYYEDAIILTIKNDILLSEEFFMESFTGDLLKLPIGGGSTAPSNIVLEVNFADDGKAFTADELIAMITGIMAGKTLVCISDNNWGTQNERRIATLARVRGFEMADGVITIGNTLSFELAHPSAFGDLDNISFLKQNDGSYELSHYFNK